MVKEHLPSQGRRLELYLTNQYDHLEPVNTESNYSPLPNGVCVSNSKTKNRRVMRIGWFLATCADWICTVAVMKSQRLHSAVPTPNLAELQPCSCNSVTNTALWPLFKVSHHVAYVKFVQFIGNWTSSSILKITIHSSKECRGLKMKIRILSSYFEWG